MSVHDDDLRLADYTAKLDAMRAAGDKNPGLTIMGEIEEYAEQVSDGERELDPVYLENQLWLLYLAGHDKGSDIGARAFGRVVKALVKEPPRTYGEAIEGVKRRAPRPPSNK